MELPTAEEMCKVEQMRSSCAVEIAALACPADDVIGDLRVCRFLRNRGGDVAEATDWYRGFLVWRVESGIEVHRPQVVGRSPDGMLAWWGKRCNPYLPLCPYGGRNDEGHLLWFIRQGLIDAVKFIEHRPVAISDDLLSFQLLCEWTLWHLDQLSRAEGRMVYVVKVADMQGLGEGGRKLPIFVPKFKSFLADMLAAMQRNYCESDVHFLVINAPFLFRVVFPVVKLMLTKKQVAKFVFLGDTKQPDVQRAFGEHVPSHLLPGLYGGPVHTLPGLLPAWTADAIEEWHSSRAAVELEYPEDARDLQPHCAPHVAQSSGGGSQGGSTGDNA